MRAYCLDMDSSVLRREAERQRLLALSYGDAPELLAYATYLDDVACWNESELAERDSANTSSRKAIE